MRKTIHIIGGGTFSYVRNHLALAAPAFGETALKLHEMFARSPARTGKTPDSDQFDPVLHLTKMARPGNSKLVTNEDVSDLVDQLITDFAVRVVVFNCALCDFDGQIGDIQSSKYADRLHTSEGRVHMELTPAEKIIGRIRKARKDIFVVGFKTTTRATPQEQYLAGLNLLKANSLNLVLANDTVTRQNMIITPEESRYAEGWTRGEALKYLVEMTLSRAQGTFTRSEVVGSEADLVPWTDDRIPANLREVVNWCIANGAYKPFRGSTAGHFAVKFSDKEFLTSRRKTNFNTDLLAKGLVRVEVDGDDRVIAHGAKPSVGGQSQRIVFAEHPGMDCIVHAHVPLRSDAPDVVSVRSQWQNECGSHQCGKNTSDGLKEYDGIKVVMLENHGPNIVFSKDVPAAEVIKFIDRNFDLSQKTGGPVEVQK